MAEAYDKKKTHMFHSIMHWCPGPSGERGFGIQMSGIGDCEENGGPLARVVYGSGTQVWVRNIEDHNQAFYYRGHHTKVTCARWAPYAPKDTGGGWIVTGDSSGNWRVWTCREDEPVTKGNAQDNFGFKCAKQVRDVAWQGDGKKICVVGAGSEEMGKCAMWDSGNQFGYFNEAGVALLSIDTTMSRPYRCIATGEGGIIYCYEAKGGNMKIQGDPVKASKKYLNCVRYHKDGEYAVAVGSDSKHIHIINGRTGEVLHSPKSHTKGSLYSVSWNPEGDHICVTGANKEVLIYKIKLDYEVKKTKVKRKTTTSVEFGDFEFECVAKCKIGEDIDDQQHSCTWASSDRIVSSSIFGDLSYIDHEGTLLKTISGHDTNVDDMAITGGEDGIIYTVSTSKCIRYCMKDRTARRYRGNHGVVGRATPAPYKFVGISAEGDTMVTVAINDTLARTNVDALKIGETVPTGGPTRWLACGKKINNLTIILAGNEGIKVFMENECVCTLAVDYKSQAADIYQDDSTLVVAAWQGESERAAEHFFVTYSVTPEGTVAETSRTEANPRISGVISRLYLCPEDENLALIVFGSDTQCYSWDLARNSPLSSGSINAVGSGQLADAAWRPGSKKVVGGAGGNSTIGIMRIDRTTAILEAGRTDLDHDHYGTITKVAWLTPDLLVCGDDTGAIRVWTASEPIQEPED